MAKRKPKPVRPITLADIANKARSSPSCLRALREGRGAPGAYKSISGVRISRKLFEEWICFAVWFYLLQGARERGQYRNAFDKVADLTGYRIPEAKQHRPRAATLAGRMNLSPIGPSDVRRIWDRNWRRYARVLVDAHEFIHQYGKPAPFDRLTRPTRLKIMTADMLIKHTSPVRFPEL
ncbi:MAG: hypothetical protein KJZ90_05080 [Rhodocyclaceae bacterium]|nr:hypothetical protein [Rhodocyclaceae bacterium]